MGSDGPGAGTAKREGVVRVAAGDTFPLVGKAVEAVSYSSSGSGAWRACGMEPDPSGAEYVARVAITQTDTATSDYPDTIESALESDGWQVDPPSDESVEASKDGLDLRARFGDGGINLSITSGCVDASKDEVRTLTDGPSQKLDLVPVS